MPLTPIFQDMRKPRTVPLSSGFFIAIGKLGACRCEGWERLDLVEAVRHSRNTGRNARKDASLTKLIVASNLVIMRTNRRRGYEGGRENGNGSYGRTP